MTGEGKHGEQTEMVYDQYGGRPPHAKGSDTSLDAATSISSDGQKLREIVFAHILNAGLVGQTCDEVETIMNGRHQTISPRVKELRNVGRIVDTGHRRETRSGRTAAVYIATTLASPELLADIPAPERKKWAKVTLGEVAAAMEAAGGFTIEKRNMGYVLKVAHVSTSYRASLTEILTKLAQLVSESM